jgi:hypothetical protein
VVTVGLYRLGCRCGYYRQRLPLQFWQDGGEFFTPTPLWSPVLSVESRKILIDRAGHLLQGVLTYYSSIQSTNGNPPGWFWDPFNKSYYVQEGHWSNLNEFSVTDIKNIWEASRFEWLLLFARAWRLTRDKRYLKAINNWLHDWVMCNPVNSDPNWKCGQEASIRLINLLIAARILGTNKEPSSNLINIIALHCSRIMPTIRYAVAQNNNHGTSEASALFIGGAWLLSQDVKGPLYKEANKWCKAGRRLLENRMAVLVKADGSFSQYSVNYHRVLVDTLCQVELWRQYLQEASFSDRYMSRCRAAVAWLESMTDADTGNAPNIGANDGARLYDLSTTDYRDFRASVQLGSVLFRGFRVYGPGKWDEPFLWLTRQPCMKIRPTEFQSVKHDDGGDLILCGDKSRAIVRFARFRFRPSHSDCLHLDLWHCGRNILRDGGTFSYNTELYLLDYFSGTESHNTIQFDSRSQMPRISRFLFGEWLKMSECTSIRKEGDSLFWSGAYVDWKGAEHRRTVTVRGNDWRVVDEINGFRDKAVLRWRLIPAKWKLTGNICESVFAKLSISTMAPIRKMALSVGWESLYYQQKTELPVLELEVGPGHWTIETEISLKD